MFVQKLWLKIPWKPFGPGALWALTWNLKGCFLDFFNRDGLHKFIVCIIWNVGLIAPRASSQSQGPMHKNDSVWYILISSLIFSSFSSQTQSFFFNLRTLFLCVEELPHCWRSWLYLWLIMSAFPLCYYCILMRGLSFSRFYIVVPIGLLPSVYKYLNIM